MDFFKELIKEVLQIQFQNQVKTENEFFKNFKHVYTGDSGSISFPESLVETFFWWIQGILR